jgi:hypothetical protein
MAKRKRIKNAAKTADAEMQRLIERRVLVAPRKKRKRNWTPKPVGNITEETWNTVWDWVRAEDRYISVLANPE